MTTGSSKPPASGSGPGSIVGSSRHWPAIAGAGLVTVLAIAVTYDVIRPQPIAPAAVSPSAGASKAATAFTAANLSGEKVSVPGGRPSVIFFFSAACGTCGSGARALAETQASAPNANYVAIGTDPNESVEVVRKFLAANEAGSLAYVRDTDASLASAYRLTQLSTAIVLDVSGTEVFRAVHPTPSEIRSALTDAGLL